MQIIIDKNEFESGRLVDFLEADKVNHKAVITDYAAMESYGGRDATKNLTSSLRILRDYTDQVIVLKSSSFASVIKPGKINRFKRLMLDEATTAEFSSFCSQVKKAEEGNKLAIEKILEKGAEAEAFFRKMEEKFDGFLTAIVELRSHFSEASINKIVKERVIDGSARETIINDILALTSAFVSADNRFPKCKLVGDYMNTFIFRFSVAAYALAIYFYCFGIDHNTSPKKLRNHVIDCNYVAYATIYDGILSSDKIVQFNYKTSKWILRNLFSSESTNKTPKRSQ